MQLSKLEIKGFKSFGDQATINFDKGVTGIVGPNGCGKSNVVDAIRWVLGEQKTKSLRSDKMENIIFNGTSQRKPSQVAQVSLTFVNDRKLLPIEYTEVVISRRFHRSGESEYLINDVRCRLKDIYNLFLDTGIGSDSYAIIELKKVDEILNDKENARRDLFEKAAGISKFKTRKKESLARLEFVDKDLDRVGDLLFEIEKNLKNLEKQAKQAERFFALKEQYRHISLTYSQKALQREKELFDSLQEKIAIENEKKKMMQANLQAKEDELEKEKLSLTHFEQALAFKQKQLQEHLTNIKTQESEKRLKNEKTGFLQEKNTSIRQQIALDIQSQNRLKIEIEKIALEQANTEKLMKELNDALVHFKEDFEYQKEKVQELQRQFKSQEGKRQQQQQLLFQSNKNLEIKQTQVNAAKQELEKTNLNDSNQKNELTAYEVSIEKISIALRIAKQELASFQEKEERKMEEIRTLENEIEEKRQILQNEQRLLDSKQNEYNLTKSLVDNMEGFPEALKYLQKDTDWGKNIPLLSDIISCDAKYRLAIENFLDPYLNFYVVNTEKDAFEAIYLLDKAQKGKANFFVLEHIQLKNSTATHQKRNNEAISFFGGLNPAELMQKDTQKPIKALEVVYYDSEHETLIRYLLQDVWVVANETEINDTHKSYVTLAGNVISRKISLTGGSVGAYEGKRIGRVRNLEKLNVEIIALKEQIGKQKEDVTFKQANLQSLKKDNSYREAILSANKQVNQINEEFITLRSKKEQLSGIILSNNARQSEIEERIYLLEEEIEQISPQVTLQQKELKALDNLLLDLNDNLTMENESLAVKSNQFNQQNVTFFQIKNKTQSLLQEINYKEEALQNLKERINHQEKELLQVENDLEILLESQENYDEILKELNSHTESYQLNVQSVEKDFYELRGKITDLEREIKEIQRQRELLDSLIQQLSNKMHETEIHLTSLKERLAAEFEINLDDLLQYSPSEEIQNMPENELKTQAEEIKQKIERLGTINALAMEEYNETKARYDFIDAQKNDLVKSKTSLMQTINEMETFAKNAFMEAFTQIRENFIKVFRSLFSGEDKADLVLAEPENPLESRIDIIAQPKGKRPLTIDQLSGGEKTLTATSLLFALYLLKPAPFCIFDEVDAPLDDANTDKFNNIIKEFSKDSQFIIVTHNKRTMAMTDVMYGVTMIQQGISSVVPVDLRELVA